MPRSTPPRGASRVPCVSICTIRRRPDRPRIHAGETRNRCGQRPGDIARVEMDAAALPDASDFALRQKTIGDS